MAGFTVHPPALRTYAGQLAEAQRAAEMAKRYVDKHGSLGMHDKGLLGMVLPFHEQLVAALDQLLGHLGDLTGTSSQAMNGMATRYEHTDLRAEAAVDASYPPVPRPRISQD